MKTLKQNLCITLTALLLLASFILQPHTGLAQTTNQVLSLDGSGDYVSIPSAPDLQNPTEITVEAWIYPTNSGSGYFIMKGDAGFANSQRSYELKWVPGSGNNLEFSIFLSASTWGAIGAAAPAGQWVHFAGTYSSADSALRIYINGVMVGQTTNDASGDIPLNRQLLRQTTLPLVLGAELTHPLGFAAGRMDEVSIWNKARTQAEIAGSMSCRLSGNEPNLTGYWNFDGGTAADLTGNGHNGALFGNAAIVPLSGLDVMHADCTPNRVLSLNGSGDYLSVTNAADLGFSSGDFTVMAWVFPRDFDSYNSVILARRAGGSRYGWILTVGGRDREGRQNEAAVPSLSRG